MVNTEKDIAENQLTSKDKERGASLVEYALLVGLIAAVVVGTLQVIGSRALNKFETVSEKLQ